MSQENVEIVRRLIDAVNRRGADADAVALFHPQVEFHEDPSFPEAEVYRGRDSVVRYYREFSASFESYRFEIEELRDTGGDKVVAVLREKARGKVSGLDVDRRSGWLFTLRDGKALQMEIFLDPAEALAAAGLSE
jgi:ketosteroid isomerase-like protein